MKILFAMSSPEYLRFYDDTICVLANRGHEVVIAANALNIGKPVRFDILDRRHPRIAVAGLIPPRDDRWTELARAVRGTMDFLRYLHPSLASAEALRLRMKRQALPSALQWLDWIPSLHPRLVSLLMNGLTAVERAIPPARTLLRFIDEYEPELVVVSPMVDAASDQVDLVKAAQARGIRVAVAVASWDNLTNKGDLRVAADLVIVWNEAQMHEAIELHRVPPESLRITGSQVFDRWFDREPSRSRGAFCRQVGLACDRPFVLYVGSSIFISRAEAEMPFVHRWIAALRTSADPDVRSLQVLVRPHPYNGSAWRPDLFDGLPGVAVWPRGGYNPVDEQNRSDYFDSIFHSAAVVGINTSAMIEAAVVGRPVLSIITPEFERTQEGTLHFRHLLPEYGGFLRIARSLDAHALQLGAVMRNPETVRGEIARFVASFVRPYGVERPCTPILVDTIEQFAASPPPRAVTAGARQAAAWPLALVPTAALAAPSRRKALRRRAE